MSKDKTDEVKDLPKVPGYVNKEDGEIYSLEIVEGDTYSKTHKARSANKFWEGNELQFKLQFDRVD